MQKIEINRLYELFAASKGVVTDSRKCTPGTIFFALRGEKFDGNDFAIKALNLGCTYAVVDRNNFQDDNRLLLVEDVLTTLQELARMHRRLFDIPVLAITGTNGKTTTKELINCALSTRFKVLCTEGNLNNHIGVPLTLLRLTKEHQYAVIEMGASHPGDINELCRIAEPTEGLITNVGKAHLEGFVSLDGVIQTKTELYRYLMERGGLIYVNPEDKILYPKVQSYNNIEEYLQTFSLIPYGPMLEFKIRNDMYVTHLFGDHNLENIRTAVAVASHRMIDLRTVLKAICAYTPGNQRSQLQKSATNTPIVDAYNANPTSMSTAIRQFNNNPHYPIKVAILGDMLELGDASQIEHRTILELLKNMDFYAIYLVGNEFCHALKNTQLNGRNRNRFLAFRSTKELVAHLKENPLRQRTILIKGSRGIALEGVITQL